MIFKKDQFVEHAKYYDGPFIVEDGGSINTEVRSEFGLRHTFANERLRLTDYQPEFKTGDKITVNLVNTGKITGMVTKVFKDTYEITYYINGGFMQGVCHHNEAKAVKPVFSDVRKGDKLRVYKPYRGMTVEGVADYLGAGDNIWFTKQGGNLVVENSDQFEILERSSLLEIPKAVGSVISYSTKGEEYIAVRGQYNTWWATKVVGAKQFAFDETELRDVEFTVLREGFGENV